MFSFTIHITPVAWQRVKRGRFGQSYVPSKTRQFKDAVARVVKANMQGAPPLAGPLSLVIRFFVCKPKRPKYSTPAVRPDLDNFCKSIFDAANGIIWEDDAQIVDLFAIKRYENHPRIEIEISEM